MSNRRRHIAGKFGAVLAALLLLVLAGCAGKDEVAVPQLGAAQGAVYNAGQGAWYDSVEDAFAAAGDGDELYLYRDAEAGALSSPADGLAVNLQGFTLTVDATGSGARGGQGLARSAVSFASGECAVSNGRIVASVGARPETQQSATSPYSGLSVDGGGSLSLSAVDVRVAYAGTSTIDPVAQVAGIATTGSVALLDGSSLSVRATASGGSYGASTAAGVRASGTSGQDGVTVSSDSTIQVVNDAQQVVQGAIGYPSTVMGTTKASNAELIEVSVGADWESRDDLQRRFLASARFDDRGDEDGFVYGTEVYYAPALELENGLTLWAFSDPVDADGAGKLQAMTPAHVFARTDFAVPLDAYGIWCAEGFSGSVKQEGAVAVQTTAGHAIGVYEASAGAYQVSEESIDASCGGDVFRADAGAFDLADFVDLDVQDGTAVAYPQQSSYTAVRQERPVAWKTAVAGAEAWDYVEAPIAFADLFSEWDAYGSAPDSDEEETTVGLSLVYYRQGQDGGYLYTGEEAGTYVYSPELDLMPVASERIVPGDVVEIGGQRSRFLGWSPRMSDKEPLYADSIVIPEGNWGSFGAKLVLYGIYEIVQDPASGQAQAPVAGAADVQQLAGSLDVSGVRDQEPFSPLGGIAVLAGFLVVLAAACLAWFLRGRSLVASAVGADDGEEAPAAVRGGSDEQRRKGGLFF